MEAKLHAKGTNGRCVCGMKYNVKTELVDSEDVTCVSCLNRIYLDPVMFLELRALKKKLANMLSCPHCGTNELLCGYNGYGGCTSHNSKEE